MKPLLLPRSLAKPLARYTLQSSQIQCRGASLTRSFCHTRRSLEDDKPSPPLTDWAKLLGQPGSKPDHQTSRTSGSTAALAQSLLAATTVDPRARRSGHLAIPSESSPADEAEDALEPFHFHIYSHKHNTHVTVTRPNRNAIISLSCGNIGFKHARRKSYDAAYQLATYVLQRLYNDGWHTKINALEVVLRGFGPGREAATKVLLGTEGKLLQDKIVRVTDATRIKFGGTRSRNPRRI